MLNDTENTHVPLIYHEDFPEIIVITCLLSIFSIIGTTGNAFVLYVFSRKKDKNTSTVFILALATTDFLTCLFIIPFTIAVILLHGEVKYDCVCKLYQFLITSNVPFSAFIMVAIAFDRYFCICRPWMKVLDIKFARRVILSLLILAITLGLVTCLAYGVYQNRLVDIPMSNSNSNFTSSGLVVSSNSSFLEGSVATGLAEDTNGFGVESNATKIKYHVPGSGDGNNIPASLNKSMMLKFTGFCEPNEVIVSTIVRKSYQKFYASLFLISFITVFFLYALIYKSLLSRRSKRLRTSVAHRYGRRSTLLTSVLTRTSHCDRSTNTPDTKDSDEKQNNMKTTTSTARGSYLLVPGKFEKEVSETSIDAQAADIKKEVEQDGNNTRLSVKLVQNDCKAEVKSNGTSKNYSRKIAKKNNNARFREILNEKSKCLNENGAISPKTKSTCEEEGTKSPLPPVNMHRQDTRKSGREKHRIANIKTAGILFIVTLVFVLAFLPAWLMAIQLIPPNMVVFYMYFSYNVANPVIYAFFNHTFQKEVKCMLKCDNWWVTV